MFRVRITRKVEKQVAEIREPERARIWERIESLAAEPRPQGVEKLKGHEDTYRLRVGEYRIVYEIHDTIVAVDVVKVGHRREVYR